LNSKTSKIASTALLVTKQSVNVFDLGTAINPIYQFSVAYYKPTRMGVWKGFFQGRKEAGAILPRKVRNCPGL